MKSELITLVSLGRDELLPPPEFFTRDSELHGRMHVARVMIHGFLLARLTGSAELEVPLWAAVFLHDLGRRHDGICTEHGLWSMLRFQESDDIQAVLIRGGLPAEHVPMVGTAVIQHCKQTELDSGHVHYPLTALLKDADALDRVRISDLDPEYLRHTQARPLIGFAEWLFETSHTQLERNDPKLMSRIWDLAERKIASSG